MICMRPLRWLKRSDWYHTAYFLRLPPEEPWHPWRLPAEMTTGSST